MIIVFPYIHYLFGTALVRETDLNTASVSGKRKTQCLIKLGA